MITVTTAGGPVTIYTQALVNNGSAGLPGLITGPGRGGNGGNGAPGGGAGDGGGHGAGGGGPGGSGPPGTDGAKGAIGKTGAAGQQGDDGKPGTPGKFGNAGTSGTITGGSFVPQFGAPQFAKGQFSFAANGPPGTAYVIQASTNLVTWTPVSTNVAPFTFSDLASTVYRYYRIGH